MKWTKTGMGQRGCRGRSRTGRRARNLMMPPGSRDQSAVRRRAGSSRGYGGCCAGSVISLVRRMVRMFKVDRPAMRVNMMAPYGVGGSMPHGSGGDLYERVQDKAAGSCREGCRGGPGGVDMTRIGRLGRMIRLGRIAGAIRRLGARIPRRRGGQKQPSSQDDGKGKKSFLHKPTFIMASLVAAVGLGASIHVYHAWTPGDALALAALVVSPSVVMLVMLWRTRDEVRGLDRTLSGISNLIESESELTRKVLGGMAGTLKNIGKTLDGMNKNFEGMNKNLEGMNKNLEGMNKNFEGMNKKLDGISGPDRPAP
ncbi:hypothetical protein CENSYa_0716 [Cenarchaeum symbiosum A]|uniref:Uncharacterized protein n=1 Tax=Cenarchaeum symbiosum (strain A) TaxID=414004 RepID=A0RVI2_CENSY|nr:hypothetical protein CENSYa_0716 [Cenarchaeum symbiosum A]